MSAFELVAILLLGAVPLATSHGSVPEALLAVSRLEPANPPRPPQLVVLQSIVPPPKDIPTIQHGKDAGGGYKEGSPLYGKQQVGAAVEPAQTSVGVAWPFAQVSRAVPSGTMFWVAVIVAVVIFVAIVACLVYRFKYTSKPSRAPPPPQHQQPPSFQDLPPPSAPQTIQSMQPPPGSMRQQPYPAASSTLPPRGPPLSGQHLPAYPAGSTTPPPAGAYTPPSQRGHPPRPPFASSVDLVATVPSTVVTLPPGEFQSRQDLVAGSRSPSPMPAMPMTGQTQPGATLPPMTGQGIPIGGGPPRTWKSMQEPQHQPPMGSAHARAYKSMEPGTPSSARAVD